MTATIHAFLSSESTPFHFPLGCFGRKITNSLASFISKYSPLFSLESFFFSYGIVQDRSLCTREKGELQLILSRGYIYRKLQIEYHKSWRQI